MAIITKEKSSSKRDRGTFQVKTVEGAGKDVASKRASGVVMGWLFHVARRVARSGGHATGDVSLAKAPVIKKLHQKIDMPRDRRRIRDARDIRQPQQGCCSVSGNRSADNSNASRPVAGRSC